MKTVSELRALLAKRTEMGVQDDTVDAVPALLDVIDGLSKSDPVMAIYSGGNHDAECALCGATEENIDARMSEFEHRPGVGVQHVGSCPWLLARAITDGNTSG